MAVLLSLSSPQVQPGPATAAPESGVAARAPRLVMIIRHGEKDEAGKSPDINATGRARAALLANLFQAQHGTPPRLPTPDILFATAPHKKSARPSETMEPVGIALREPVDLAFGKDDDAALAREVLSGKYAGKVVLICWHHGAIPMMARDFGIADPPTWSDQTYDRIWEIDWNAGSAHLTVAPEKLMPGDSAQ